MTAESTGFKKGLTHHFRSHTLSVNKNTFATLPANFTGDSPFHLDDIRRAGEAEASQNSLPALQLVHLQDGPSFLQLSLGRSNVC